MRKTVIQLIKNTSVVYAVEIISRVFGFLFVIYAARVMGVKGFGDFSYAMAVLMIVGVISDFGASNLLVKMSAQNASMDRDFWTYTIIRTAITTVTLLVVLVYLRVSGAEEAVLYFTVLIGAGMVLGCYGQNMGFVYRGLNKMHIDGVIRVSMALFAALFGIAALRAGLGLIGVGGAYLISYVVSSVVAFAINRRNAAVRFALPGSLKEYVPLIKASAPFFVWMVLSVVYSRADTIMLQHMKGAEAVGLYSAAGRVAETIIVIPMGIYIGILPILSSLVAERDSKTIEFISHLAIKYMTYLGLFIACFIGFTSDKVIEIIYFSGEYSGAILPLQILIWSTVPPFIYMVLVALIVSGTSPGVTVRLSSISIGVNLLANLIVIPRWGFLGASAVRVSTELLGLLIGIIYIHRTAVKIRYKDFLPVSVAASLVMAAVISFAKSLLFAPIYFVVYVTVLYALKGISKEEFIEARELISNILKKE